jgi:hypothetical protein
MHPPGDSGGKSMKNPSRWRKGDFAFARAIKANSQFPIVSS